MKVVNSVALPIVGLVKWMMMKLEGLRGPVDFLVVKMDDFDVVLGMEFIRQSVLPTLVDHLFVRNNPKVHKIAKEWEQKIDITRACLEKASRQMKKREDQKRCPPEFERRIRFLTSNATMANAHLLIYNRKKIVKSKKSLLTEQERVEDPQEEYMNSW
ncbi:hypothetical protein E5676_scaffold600G00980 [Cucumis melo var. makuwa]|uniref:Uncharacterized protein n=1 Tax=Cucumis melo var. makuwa TaxID=1194695 RepID=A0A5D3DXN2_CUCMM|nr:hypothetical protein E5676_scaffold600G00980 [Cucumis melo var. makuwa]